MILTKERILKILLSCQNALSHRKEALVTEGKYATWTRSGGVLIAHLRYVRILQFEEYAALETELNGLAETEVYPPQAAPRATRGIDAVIINCDALEYFTSRLLGILAALSRKLRDAGRKLAVCRLRPEPLRTFRICRLDSIIPVYPSEQEAREAFAKE